MKKLITLLFGALLLLLLPSCNDGSGNSIDTYEEPSYDFTDVEVYLFSSAPYLDILNGEIVDASATLEYSLDGGTNWTDCGGSLVSVSLSIGNHVLIRDKSITASVRDLGTVESLSGRADLKANNKLYIGSGAWDDNMTGAPGDTFNIFSYILNIGDTTAGSQNVKYYLSADTNIDPTEDTLLLDHDYNYIVPADGSDYYGDCRDIDITVPDVAPGTYYVAAVLDSDNSVTELNEGNNTTAPEDMAVMYISSGESLASGAMKIVNSWGTGSWGQNVTGDGHYWMPYESMIANNMAVYFYTNDFDSIYEPKVMATFKLSHDYRDEIKITLGLGSDPSNPVIEKFFEARNYSDNPIDGSYPFPDNVMVMDITEFAYAINDYDLFMSIENIGTTTGTLDSFSVEFYDDYPNSSLSTTELSSSDTGEIASSDTKTAWISTADSLSLADLISITPLTRSTSTGTTFVLEKPDDDEIVHDREIIGTYEEGKNYNVLYQGKYGTGLQPPREEDWESMLKLRSVDSGTTRATFDGDTLPDAVDNSATNYFPPIGNQGGKGSCSAFSVGYYIQTYTEAREHGWDLSAVTWVTDSTGLSESGSPDGSLDKIFSPDFIYHQINSGVDNGSYIGYATELAIRQGGATWANMPYVNKYNDQMTVDDYTHWPSEDAWRDAPLYRGEKTGNYYWTNNQSGYFLIEDDSDIQLLKSLLSMGYIVSTAIHDSTVFDHLDSNDVMESGYTWSTTNHAQTIVGYKEGSAWDASNPDA